MKKRRPAPSPPAAPAAGPSGDVAPGARATTRGVAGERRVELAHHLRRGALLRAVDGRGAARPGERVVDVAGHQHLGGGRGAGRGRTGRCGRGGPAPRRPPAAPGRRRRGSGRPARAASRRRRRWWRCRRCRSPAGAARRRARPGSAGRCRSVVVTRGSRRARGTSGSPEAAAISMTAVRPSPSTPQAASTGSPSGPRTAVRLGWPAVASSSASTVPSPPSAMGTFTTSAPGKTARTPRSMAWATCSAEALPLNESGATMTRIPVSSPSAVPVTAAAAPRAAGCGAARRSRARSRPRTGPRW